MLRYSGWNPENGRPALPISARQTYRLYARRNTVPENPAGEGSPQATQQPPVVVYNPIPQPPPPPPPNNTLKIILIVVAVIVVIGILVLGAIGYMGYRIAHSLHVNPATGETTITTPAGTISANDHENFTAADLGVDLYPGAEPGKGSMRMTMPTGPVVSASYLTSDSKDKVAAFYKDKLGSQATSMDFGGSSMVTLKKGDREQITVTIVQQAGQFDGKTQIHIMHTTVNKTQ